eukprot:494773_1
MAFVWGKFCLYAGGFGGLLVTFNPHPFAEGSTKQSHEAIYDNEAPSEKYGRKAVVKKLKNGIHKSKLTIKHEMNTDIKIHKISAEYASMWNSARPNTKPINVQIPYLTQIDKTNRWLSLLGMNRRKHKHVDGEYITVEDHLDGSFEKFNSNTGWVKRNESSLNAFSHWSYHHSNGKYLICDLQGVDSDNGSYELTDPVVMSEDTKFGTCDLGVVGISNWFYHHSCNEYCDANWKKPDKIEKCDEIDCEQETSHSIDIANLEL